MYKTKVAAAFAAFAAVFSRRVGGVAQRSASLFISGADDTPGVVRKTVFSEKRRMIFVVGLEGSGHHYLNGALNELCKSRSVKCPEVCSIADLWYGELGKFSTSSEYKTGLERLSSEMDALALDESDVGDSTAVSVVTFYQGCSHKTFGEMSFPNFGGDDKPLQYVDLKILAEEAERVGIDLRLIYVGRSSKEILISTTEKRSFGSFAHEARVLINSASVVGSSLRELDPDFVTCFAYGDISAPAQASRVAEFVMPTKESAIRLSQIMLDLAKSHSTQTDTEMVNHQEGWELVSHRLQEKLDEIERDQCY